MKSNIRLWVLTTLAATALAGCKNEDVERHHFENKLYVSSPLMTDDLLIDPTVRQTTRTVSMRLAQPAAENVRVRVQARPDLAAQYNQIYRDNAFALPADYWQLPETTVEIQAGTISAGDIPVEFIGINELDVKMRYVLPVTISTENVPLLDSRSTVYFIIRGAALINVVADITKLKAQIVWSAAAASHVRAMRQLTFEALIRSKDWTGGRQGYGLSTIFGIEGDGKFLLRIGDSDRGPNQLQMVHPGGKWPSKAQSPALPENEWVHIALVYDAQNREMRYYQNGQEVASTASGSSLSVNLMTDCWIGYAYDEQRWFPGEMSEVRLWNIVRTQEEIAENPYRVDPSTPGLVAYWKFDEGQGRKIFDHTPNGTNITFARNTGQTESDDPTWVPVEIPALK